MKPTGYCVLCITLASLLACADAHAQRETAGPWTLRTDFQILTMSYDDVAVRDRLGNAGVFLRADYLERGGFTLGYNATRLSFADGSPDVDQDNLFLSGRYVLTPDALDGRLTLRLDAYDVSNDDASGTTDDVTVLSPQLAYLNFAETFYFDVGFARSRYGDTPGAQSGLVVDQLTPTLGFGFNERRDWLQLRAYLSDLSNAAQGQAPASGQGQGQGQAGGQGQAASQTQAQAGSSRSAVELKWTHWLPGGGFLGLDNVRFSLLAGERLYAVDPDAASVFNLSELQTGAVGIGGEWTLGERSSVLLLLGDEKYEDSTLGQSYRGGYLYLNFSHRSR